MEIERTMEKGLEFFLAFLHILGGVTLAGGHIWLAFFIRHADQTPKGEGKRVLVKALPGFSTLMGLSVLVLFLSGAFRIFLWDEPSLLFLPAPYGWILLTKIVLYCSVVVNGVWIEQTCVTRLLRAGDEDAFSLEWSRFKRNARLNFLLIMIIVSLGETLSFSQA
jgi:uncharacterized membrane protein